MALVSRIPHKVCSSDTRAPRSRANSATPKPTAARHANNTGRAPRPSFISGPLASTTPAMATAIPHQAKADGFSPLSTPSNTGMPEPTAAMGATTPMVPVESAA